MPNLYVVGFDDSPAGRRAVDFAVDSAKQSGASILIAHVLEWSPYSFLTPTELEERHKRRTEELERAKAAVVDPIVDAISSKGVDVKSTIRYGNVADTLCAIASDEGATQIFIGRTGNPGMAARVFGSVAGSLAQAAPVACTIIP